MLPKTSNVLRYATTLGKRWEWQGSTTMGHHTRIGIDEGVNRGQRAAMLKP